MSVLKVRATAQTVSYVLVEYGDMGRLPPDVL